MGGAVDDRRVDHLAAAASSGLVEGGQHAHQQVHAPAGEVADEVEWDLRGTSCLPDRVQRSRGRDVRDVMPGGMCDGAILTPPGHASVDQLGSAQQAWFGADPETFGHPGTESFEQDVGVLCQGKHCLGATGFREIDGNRALSAVEQVVGPRHELHPSAARAVDTHHVGTQIREQHSAEWPRSDSGYLENLHAGQWASRHFLSCLHSSLNCNTSQY